MNPTNPTKKYNPGDDAARLVRLAESGDLKTSGSWISWCNRIKGLPYQVRLWVWRRLKTAMSEDSIRYLKWWCER